MYTTTSRFMIPVNVSGKASGKNALENQKDPAFPSRHDLEQFPVVLTVWPNLSRIGAFHSRHPLSGSGSLGPEPIPGECSQQGLEKTILDLLGG